MSFTHPSTSLVVCHILRSFRLPSAKYDTQVPIERMAPVILRSLCMHDYATGEPINDYDLSDYKEKWGHEYYMFHRQDMHKTLLEYATSEEGEGFPVQLFVNHRVQDLDCEAGRVRFTNGKEITADLVVGADGIRVSGRESVWLMRLVVIQGACPFLKAHPVGVLT